jgi:hypothetical protein
MKGSARYPVDTNDVQALSISFSFGEFLDVLSRHAPARKQKKKNI